MGHDNWFNEEYMAQKRSEVIHVSKDIIDKKISIIEGVRKLCALHHKISKDDFDTDFLIFAAIDSDTDHLPVGNVREHWSLNALEMKDKEICDVEDIYRDQVIEACKKLILRFEKNL